ncbi:MAG: class D beta-lactamase [Bacteroides sp.]|jgi:beta-lactamase class D|nr:class D beta-lactamase [Bacteroides sp.]
MGVKLINFLFILLLLSGCNPSNRQNQPSTSSGEANNRVEFHAFQQLLDGASVKGAILVYNAREETLLSNDFSWCQQGHLPASTFKIPNTIIALETGVANEQTLFPWDGQERALDAWEQDLNLREAFHFSCVPCYQEIARKVGSEQMKLWLDKLSYGTMDVRHENIDRFWLEGNSKINPFQQVDFLRRFYFKELPITDQTHHLMKQIMVIESQNDWTLSGKTGWSIREGHNTGWFVGYLEKGGEVYFIATCIQPTEAFNMDMFNIIRRQISLEAFRVMEVIQ